MGRDDSCAVLAFIVRVVILKNRVELVGERFKQMRHWGRKCESTGASQT